MEDVKKALGRLNILKSHVTAKLTAGNYHN
jgi:hypothetical protein